MIGPEGQLIVGVATPADGEETATDGTIGESNFDDDDDMENWLSVATIEAELKPKVIESFDTIADTYKRLRTGASRPTIFGDA